MNIFGRWNRRLRGQSAGAGRHTAESTGQEMTAIDTSRLPWEERFKEELGKATYRKVLLKDPDTGMEVRLVRYPAGVMNVWHTHPCAHGMYVLEGTLATHAGRHGPGSFVWFPEGMAMEHGAPPDGDVTVLFITNKPFEIFYQAHGADRPPVTR